MNIQTLNLTVETQQQRVQTRTRLGEETFRVRSHQAQLFCTQEPLHMHSPAQWVALCTLRSLVSSLFTCRVTPVTTETGFQFLGHRELSHQFLRQMWNQDEEIRVRPARRQ